jgi:hypothetical protein
MFEAGWTLLPAGRRVPRMREWPTSRAESSARNLYSESRRVLRDSRAPGCFPARNSA